MQRLAHHRGLADWVTARNVLPRRVAGMPRLARFVGLAPEHNDERVWAAFRPRAVPRLPFSAGSALVVSDAVPDLPMDMPRLPATPFEDETQGAPTEDAAPALPAVPAGPSTGQSPPRVTHAIAPPSSDVRPRDALPPAPRERMGRRITEEPPRPVSRGPEPMPPAPSPGERAPANMAGPTRRLPPILGASDAQEPARAALMGGPDDQQGAEDAPSPSSSEAPHATASEPDAAPAVSDGAREPGQRPALSAPNHDEPGSRAAATPADLEPRDQQSSPDRPSAENQRAGPATRADLLVMPAPSVPDALPDKEPGAAQREGPESAPPAVVSRDDPAASVAPATMEHETPDVTRSADRAVPPDADRAVATWAERLAHAAASEGVPVHLHSSVTPPNAPEDRPVPLTPGNERVQPPPSAPRRFVAPVVGAPPAVPDPRVDPMPTTTPVSPEGESPTLARAAAAGTDREIHPTAAGQDAAHAGMPGPAPEGQRDTPPSVAPNDWFINPAEPIRAEALFQSQGADRSPAAWLARLTGAPPPSSSQPPAARPVPAPRAPETPEPVAGSLPMRTALSDRVETESPPPSPLPETTRRFLRPLVGVDPAVMPVYHDTRAAAVTDAYHADALTDGNVAMLAAGREADAPETLGLLAHELTHVARRRDPRFVPPIARADDWHDQPPAGSAAATSATALLADEEALARRVEARVVRAARAYRPASVSPPSLSSDRDLPLMAWMPARPRAPEPMRAVGRQEHEEWNGLPAPWEPLPDWLAVTAPEPVAPTTGAGESVAATPVAPVMPAPQLAEEGHESEGARAATTPPAPQDPNTPVEPDLDTLARQVYAILKRRLALERRSAG